MVSTPILSAATEGDATSEGVRCAQDIGKPLTVCDGSVAAREGTSLSVVVTFPTGFARTLIFEDGSFIRANATMSGVGTDANWDVSDGIYRIRVDDQRFELPEALIVGE